jgi:CheY-like chemotaxis protein
MRHPDVALLDVRMPGGGGPHAAREIRWRSPDTRIVALSAHRDERSVDNMLANGATSYLVKDSDLDDIMHAVTRSVDGDALLADGVVQHVVSELGSRLAHEHGLEEERSDESERIRRLIDGRGGLEMAYQPIVELSSGRIVGIEALARFPSRPERAPDVWFKEATEIGLGTELQVAAVELALAAIDVPPPDTFVSVNVDPNAAASPELADVLRRWPGERLVIELTEHAPASDYPSLREALDAFRRSGIRIAVDDAGADSRARHPELAPTSSSSDISIARHRYGPSHPSPAAPGGLRMRDRHRTDRRRGETAEEVDLRHQVRCPGLHGPAGPIPDRFVSVAERQPSQALFNTIRTRRRHP